MLEGAANILENRNVPLPGEEPPAAQASAEAPAPDVKQAPAEQPSQPATGEEDAKNAAFAHAGVSDAALLHCRLEWDDGRQVYDIEFRAGNTEYDYKIDAATGAVLEAELEQKPAQPSGGFIGEEAAKSAALAHAGLSGAGFIDWELEEEDGRGVYKLEFRSGGAEYDYEIDASTGAVLKAELDS